MSIVVGRMAFTAQLGTARSDQAGLKWVHKRDAHMCKQRQACIHAYKQQEENISVL